MSFPLLLIPMGFMVFCGYMLSHALRQFELAKASLDWPTTTGVLELVSLWGTRNINGKMEEAERLTVSYSFDVKGVSYSSGQVSNYQLHYPETFNFANAHPVKSEVKVHYNPIQPSEAVLIAGPHPTKPHGPIILALFGLLVSAAVTIAAWLGLLS